MHHHLKVSTVEHLLLPQHPGSGKGLERLIKRAGHPLNLNISEERRPVRENNELLSREIGLVTRYHAPIKRIGSQSLTEADKEPLYALLKLKFNLDFTQAHVKGCVELLFYSSYKSFRHKCYDHYLKSRGGDNARSNPYMPLAGKRVSDWIWLYDYFETENFQILFLAEWFHIDQGILHVFVIFVFHMHKRSTTGKANRLNLPYVHKKGTKSFVALQHELNCGEIALYKECYSNEKGWASTNARDKHEEMLELQQEAIQEGETAITEQQICERVLGKAYGYIRGRGHGPKPNRRASSSASNSAQHVEEELASTKELVATQQTQIEYQQTQIEAQQKRIDWLQSVVSNLARILPPMDDTSAGKPDCRTAPTTSSDGAGSMVSDGVSTR